MMIELDLSNSLKDDMCFAEHAKQGKCSVLTVGHCIGHDKCAFYKTEEQVKIEQQKVFKRIASLPYDNQKYISKYHYGGKMPWHEVNKNDKD